MFVDDTAFCAETHAELGVRFGHAGSVSVVGRWMGVAVDGHAPALSADPVRLAIFVVFAGRVVQRRLYAAGGGDQQYDHQGHGDSSWKQVSNNSHGGVPGPGADETKR